MSQSIISTLSKRKGEEEMNKRMLVVLVIVAILATGCGLPRTQGAIDNLRSSLGKAASTPTVTPAPKQYAGLVRIAKPPKILNGMTVPPFSNLWVGYVGTSLGSGITVSVGCPQRNGSLIQYPVGSCGLILGAFVDGQALREEVRNKSSAENATFFYPETGKTGKILSVDIWLPPNYVYTATWELGYGSGNQFHPIGPLEYTENVGELTELVKQVKFPPTGCVKEKTGVGFISIPEKLRPYLFEIRAFQVGDRVNDYMMVIHEDLTHYTVAADMKPGYYLIDARFRFPQTQDSFTGPLTASDVDNYLCVEKGDSKK